MGKKRDVHVVPHEDGWATKREGASRAGAVHRTQRAAIERGREQAQRNKTELVVHR